MANRMILVAVAGVFALGVVAATIFQPAAASPRLAPNAAGLPACPSSWPSEPTGGPTPHASISYQDFYTDSNGDRWFVVKSTDSNGNTMARAYPADSRYQSGYGAASPDETCFMLLRRWGDAADLDPPEQVTFPAEREERTVTNDSRSMEVEVPVTLRQIIAEMTPAERVDVILCLLEVAGNTDPDEFLDDPAYVQVAIDAGCIPPQ